jgi:hypothetical protein
MTSASTFDLHPSNTAFYENAEPGNIGLSVVASLLSFIGIVAGTVFAALLLAFSVASVSSVSIKKGRMEFLLGIGLLAATLVLLSSSVIMAIIGINLLEGLNLSALMFSGVEIAMTITFFAVFNIILAIGSLVQGVVLNKLSDRGDEKERASTFGKPATPYTSAMPYSSSSYGQGYSSYVQSSYGQSPYGQSTSPYNQGTYGQNQSSEYPYAPVSPEPPVPVSDESEELGTADKSEKSEKETADEKETTDKSEKSDEKETADKTEAVDTAEATDTGEKGNTEIPSKRAKKTKAKKPDTTEDDPA